MKMNALRPLKILILLSLLIFFMPFQEATGIDNIFESRILPIARSQKSSSCTECHFGGVELQNYIGDTEAETFASLRDQGLIDVNQPAKSKILTFISRHGKDTTKLISRTRQAEYEAFKSWIVSAAKNPKLLSAKTTKKTGLRLPAEVVLHLRKDRVLESFYENIWVELGRCVNCHSPNRNKAQVKKHGEQMSWIVPGDLEATLKKCVDNQIIDLNDPEESQILTKPNGTEEHGGGPKFAVGSESDKAFRKFLIDYSNTVGGEYQKESDLPKATELVRHPTFQFLKITNIPKKYSDKFLQVRLYRKTEAGWSTRPVAIADNPVNGKQSVWMSSLFQLLGKDSHRLQHVKKQEYSKLPVTTFKLEIYVDQSGKLKRTPTAKLSKSDIVKTVELGASWPTGYQKPKTVNWTND